MTLENDSFKNHFLFINIEIALANSKENFPLTSLYELVLCAFFWSIVSTWSVWALRLSRQLVGGTSNHLDNFKLTEMNENKKEVGVSKDWAGRETNLVSDFSLDQILAELSEAHRTRFCSFFSHEQSWGKVSILHTVIRIGRHEYNENSNYMALMAWLLLL